MLDSTQNNYLIQALATYTTRVEECIGDMPAEMLEWRPDEDKWSVQMVLAHLASCESFFQARLKKIVAEENPVVAGFGPETARPISDKLTSALLEDLAVARKQTLTQIYTYSTDDWDRPAVHSVQGATTLKGQIQNIVMHDTEHLGQMYDLCEMWQLQRDQQELT